MIAAELTPEEQAEREQRKRAQCAQKWIGELGVSEKSQRKWLDRAKKIVKRYRKDHGENDAVRRFAMLWTNVQTIQPAIYARPPQPVVSRRFKDADPVARIASEIIERCLSYSVDRQDLDGKLRATSFDFVLIGRGQTWERYVPTHGPQVIPQIPLQVVTNGEDVESYTDEDGNAYEVDSVKGDPENGFYAEGEAYEPVVFEESITDYVNWEDFGTGVARTWDEVPYVWRRVYLDRDQLIDRFGEEIGKKVPLDWGPKTTSRGIEESIDKKAAVYEIWDKASKKAYWISKSYGEGPLDERDDPLGLDGFFPCPRPLLGTTANDSTLPVPDYVYYQDQAEEIDDLTARIAVLQKALKVRGFYAGDIKTNLNNLLNADTNVMIPVPEWQSLKDGGGINGKIEWFPITMVVQALQACVQARQQLMNDVYQITGVADILRGASDPRETAAAQGIKAQWGSLRVRDRQIEMQRFARDILRIKGEVIAEKFSADTLRAMSGVKLPTNAEKQQAELKVQELFVQAQAQAAQAAQAQAMQPPQPGGPAQAPMGHNGGPPMAPPQIPEELQEVLTSPTWEDVEALLQDNALRQFRIDIETDSTIEPNEQEEKARTVELLSALSNLVQQWGPAIVAQPAIAPMVGEMIKFALRRFRAGRTLEDVIDSTIDKLVKEAASAPPPGQGQAAPPPDQTAVQVAAIEQQTEQMVQQAETERARMDATLEAQDLQLRQGDQQLKLVAINRDPYPQGAA